MSKQLSSPELEVTQDHFIHLKDGRYIHYVECLPRGESKGDVLFVHGFPDYWGTWKDQLSAAALAGYRAIAIDTPGYGRSSALEAVTDCSLISVTDMLAEFVSKLCPRTPIPMLVGHDFGAFICWGVGARYPDLFERLTIINVPHMTRFLEGLTTWSQMRKSWYIWLFQLPRLPEFIMFREDYHAVRETLRTVGAQPRKIEDVEEHVLHWRSNPATVTSAINFYRALGRGLWGINTRSWGLFAMMQRILKFFTGGGFRAQSYQEIVGGTALQLPTQVIWGSNDLALNVSMADPPLDLVPRKRPTIFLPASHFVHWDLPDEVNKILLSFLNEAV
mmetsp:Transcript_21825/g.47543  ORF Transcript_21825/g.47543 Transcript_21825/m.47543 type:complete len:333 (-) Transcript_21825:70-1068(-)